MTHDRDLSDGGVPYGTTTGYFGTHTDLNAGLSSDELEAHREAAYNGTADPKTTVAVGGTALIEGTVIEFGHGVSQQIDADLLEILGIGEEERH